MAVVADVAVVAADSLRRPPDAPCSPAKRLADRQLVLAFRRAGSATPPSFRISRPISVTRAGRPGNTSTTVSDFAGFSTFRANLNSPRFQIGHTRIGW